MRLLHILCGSVRFFRVTNTVQPDANEPYFFGFATPIDDANDRRVADYRERTTPRGVDLPEKTSVFFRSTDRVRTLHLGPAVLPDPIDRRPGRAKIIVGVAETCHGTEQRHRMVWWFRDGRALLSLRNLLLRRAHPPSVKSVYRQLERRDPLFALIRCARKDLSVLDPTTKHLFKRRKYDAERGYALEGVDPGLFAAAAAVVLGDPTIYAIYHKTYDDPKFETHSAYMHQLLEE